MSVSHTLDKVAGRASCHTTSPAPAGKYRITVPVFNTAQDAMGGLIGGGHPVGATGVRMLLDAHRQVTDSAGDCQIAGAERLLTFNLGGSTTTSVCLIVEAGAA